MTHVGLGHSGEITRLKICPHGQHIVSVSADGAVLKWKFPFDVNSGDAAFHENQEAALNKGMNSLNVNKKWILYIISLYTLIPQNGQTHSNNSSVNYQRIVLVCLTILWGWRLKGYDWFKLLWLTYFFDWLYIFLKFVQNLMLSVFVNKHYPYGTYSERDSSEAKLIEKLFFVWNLRSAPVHLSIPKINR